MFSKIVCLENGYTLLKLRVHRVTQNNNNALWSKSVLTWYDSQIQNNCLHISEALQ